MERYPRIQPVLYLMDHRQPVQAWEHRRFEGNRERQIDCGCARPSLPFRRYHPGGPSTRGPCEPHSFWHPALLTRENLHKYRAEARSVAFRWIVVEAYAQACALCGVRLLTSEGRTAVVAAHIIPWRVTHKDDPRNGLALCGLHHWTFDEGPVTVERGYTVKVSPVVHANDGSAALGQLAGGGLRLPADPDLMPAAEALAWHADQVYRSSATRRLL